MADQTETVDDDTKVDDENLERDDEQSGSGEEDESKVDWKAEARKHERRAKQERREREKAQQALSEREQADLSEHEQAIKAAREEGRTEALTEAQRERRHDRLEVAVTRLAAKTFNDTDDALMHVERAIERGELDADEIFDGEGKVQTDALREALEDLLERKPHLKAGAAVTSGDSDAGKGSGNGKSEMDKTPAEILKEIQGR